MRLSFDLPVIVDIVDTEPKIMGFLPMLNGMMSNGLSPSKRCRSCNMGAED